MPPPLRHRMQGTMPAALPKLPRASAAVVAAGALSGNLWDRDATVAARVTLP